MLTNPENGSCHTFTVDSTGTTALRLVNYTDHKVEVYGEAHCEGPGIWTLNPHEEHPSDDAMSIEVWATDETP